MAGTSRPLAEYLRIGTPSTRKIPPQYNPSPAKILFPHHQRFTPSLSTKQQFFCNHPTQTALLVKVIAAVSLFFQLHALYLYF